MLLATGQGPGWDVIFPLFFTGEAVVPASCGALTAVYRQTILFCVLFFKMPMRIPDSFECFLNHVFYYVYSLINYLIDL